MIKIVVTLLLLLPGLALAVICKTVDADGVVSYTDMPPADCPQQVKLPEYSRYQPRPIDRPAGPQASDATGSAVRFVRYESIAITQPKTGGTVRSNEGRVTVVIALQPALQPGHRIGLTIDGRKVEGEFDSLAIDLSGVDRGTHTLRANVADATGKILISTAPVSFTLRKTGLTDSNASNAPEPPAKPDPGFPASDTPADYTPSGKPNFGPAPDPDFEPGTKPDYSAPVSPGFAPNGAFTPKYTP